MSDTPAPRMLRGDEAELFDRHSDPLKRAVHRAVRATPETIEDACAFAWLEFLRHQPDRERTFLWLRLVAIRKAWAIGAEDRRADHLELVPTAEHLTAPSDVPRREARLILSAIAELPEDQRRCITLTTAGRTVAETAALTGHGRGTVNACLAAARSRLRTVCDPGHSH